MKGFTLVELMISIAIIAILSGILIANFSHSKISLDQVLPGLIDALRTAQSQALAGALYQGTYRCGYGVHFTASSYMIYVAPSVNTVNCATQDRNYNVGTDTIVSQTILPDANLEIVLPASDVFYQPPNPKVYINGVDGGGALLSTTIVVRLKGTTCPSTNCRTVYLTNTGIVQAQ